jgi:hypothetical protein
LTIVNLAWQGGTPTAASRSALRPGDPYGRRDPVDQGDRSAWRETSVLEKIRLKCVFAVVMEILNSAAASLRVAPVVETSHKTTASPTSLSAS